MHDNTFIPQVCLVSFECTVQGLGISLSKARDHKDLTMSVIRTMTVTITGLREFFFVRMTRLRYSTGEPGDG